MKDVSVTENGELKLSTKKIVVLSLIVAFFSIVANRWEWRQHRIFRKHVKYRTFTSEHLQKVLDDFECMVSCQDPYIENFNKKNPEFAHLHHLWTLNSHGYWTTLFKKELQRRNTHAL